MRIGLYILGIALVALCGVVSYLCQDSLFTFEPTPLLLPVVVAPAWHTQAPFQIQRSGAYEVQFDCENPSNLRPTDYSAWDASVKSARIRWEVMAGQRPRAEGSSGTYPENWYGRGGGNEASRTGHEIGSFTADAGTHYLLRVVVDSGDKRLNEHRPRVNIQLNGQELSDLSNVDEAREFVHRQARRAAIVGLAVVVLAVVLEVFAKRGAA
jgi:hypothetical protein